MMPVECSDICAAADAQPFLNKVFQFGIDCRILHTYEFSTGKKSYSLGISIFYIHKVMNILCGAVVVGRG